MKGVERYAGLFVGTVSLLMIDRDEAGSAANLPKNILRSCRLLVDASLGLPLLSP